MLIDLFCNATSVGRYFQKSRQEFLKNFCQFRFFRLSPSATAVKNLFQRQEFLKNFCQFRFFRLSPSATQPLFSKRGGVIPMLAIFCSIIRFHSKEVFMFSCKWNVLLKPACYLFLSLMLLSSCNTTGGKDRSIKLSVSSDQSGTSSAWDQDTIQSNYALLFQASDYQAGLSLTQQLQQAATILKLDSNYEAKLNLKDSSGSWIAQVRGYEEDLDLSELSRYGVHQSAISGEFQIQTDGSVTAVSVKSRQPGKHFPITGQLISARSTGSSCSFDLSVSGEQTRNIGNRGYVADIEVYAKNGDKLTTFSNSALQFDLSPYSDRVKTLQVQLKIKTGVAEASEKLPVQTLEVKCDSLVIANNLQTLEDSSQKTYALSPLLLETQVPLTAFQNSYDAKLTCTQEANKLLVSQDNFSTCESIDVFQTAAGQYLILPKQAWKFDSKYLLGVRETAGQPPTLFGNDQKTPSSFHTGQQAFDSTSKHSLAVQGMKEFSLTPNGQYAYIPENANWKLAYHNKHGDSFQQSNGIFQVSATLRIPLSAPTNLVVVQVPGSETQAKITWNAVTRATKYQVFYRHSRNYIRSNQEPTSPVFNHTSMTPGKVYAYKVKACNSAGCSDESREVSVALKPKPSTPKGLVIGQIAGSETQTRIKWLTVPGASHYKLYRSTSSGSGYTLAHTTSDGLTASWINTGLTKGTTYYYKISAVNTWGESGKSSQQSVALKTSLSAPTISSVTQVSGSETQATISWSAVTGASHYKVYRSRQVDRGFVLEGNNISATSWTNTGLTRGTTYYYKVSAVNVVGESAQSSQQSIDLKTKPSTSLNPQWGNCPVRPTYCTIDFPDVPGATYYQASDGGKQNIVHFIPRVAKLSRHTIRFVQACNVAGCSAWHAIR